MKIRASLAILVVAGLAGCTVIPAETAPTAPPPPSSTPPPKAPPPPVSNAPLTFAALNETVSVDGLQVTPKELLEDSRCPMNARCIWAGQVRLRISVHGGLRRKSMEITSGKPLQVADGTLELVEVRPDKVTTRNDGAIESDSYRFGFRFMGGF
ncbi:hypothetical protein [Novosphingobium malaysiense]|uniref:Lipoprotein n=1 Tax=Novosphingobium malaysiense TaxID=1348853 RepID=A0A0B1ZQ21_9SPHN|nr:hypothetical protein [Novosphingobium malaysiense]KHK91358.1 hypothetical protein LK12_10860 [Novosphingobium malaysiense]